MNDKKWSPYNDTFQSGTNKHNWGEDFSCLIDRNARAELHAVACKIRNNPEEGTTSQANRNLHNPFDND
ncbi:MAG: hypothetical protein P9M14_12955 [Candidatus Alcyoniella australis]|nr:hypothetical protein [Candidatus Alcyoniella australis]